MTKTMLLLPREEGRFEVYVDGKFIGIVDRSQRGEFYLGQVKLRKVL